jgi:hypothetical protein
VRYTPAGSAYFSDLSKHPAIFVAGPHGRTSAAGRYQFVKTTWDGLGGGDFSPASQDRAAWKLAQRDYRASSGRDLDADLKAGGLTPQILSTLTPTWQAFKGNRGRHIATYQESLARYASATPQAAAAPLPAPPGQNVMPLGPTDAAATAPAGGPPAAPAGAPMVTLTGNAGPLPQRPKGTLYGDTFNRAATDIYVNRLDTALRGQVEALSLQHEGNPAALSEALDALKSGFTSDLPPPAAALMLQTFEAQKFAAVRGATLEMQKRIEGENLAAFEENISARITGAMRIASKAGIDPEADARLDAELGAITTSIDQSPLTPLQKSRMRQEAESGVLSQRILSAHENLADPGARAAYTAQVQKEWQEGQGVGGRLDAATYEKVNGELLRRGQADNVAAGKREAALDKSIDSQIGFLKKGFPVPAEMRGALQREVAAANNPQLSQNLAFLDSLADWQKAHVAAPPAALDAQIEAMRGRIAKDGITEAAATTLDVMESLRDEMAKGLATDPLTWANRAGVAQVEPLDFSDGPALAASLSERVADANAVASHYGISPKFFTPAETDGLKKMLAETPLALPSIVSSLTAGLGSDTARALAEVSDDAPILAHVAGLHAVTGSQRATVEIAEALEMRRQPGYKSALPTPAKLQGAAQAHLAGALGPDSAAMAQVSETAAALFERRAAVRGISPEDFDEGTPARELYVRALEETLGATWRDGVRYGGTATVNGRATIAPPDVPADALEAMIENLTGDDMLFQGMTGSANGVPIALSQIRAGQLVRVGPSRYRVATGDIEGGDPRYVPGADGGYFELDIGMLARTQQRRGAAAPSGRTGQFGPNWAEQIR